MKRRLLSILILLLVCLGLMTGAVLLQRQMIYRWRLLHPKFRDTLYLPSSEYVRTVAVGYDMFTADFLWLRMIQVFAAGWTTKDSPRQMKHYFDIVTDLNPRFLDVYSFAILAVGEEHRRHDLVKDIVDKAIRKNPFNHEIPHEGAFHALYRMNDMEMAKTYVQMAKMDPNYPEYMDRWEGYLDVKQGKYHLAYEKFLGDFLRAIDNGNSQIYGIWRIQLNRAVNEWIKFEIRQRAGAWNQEHGYYPTVEQLNADGAFRGVELPDVPRILRELISLIGSDWEGARNLEESQIRQFTKDCLKIWDHLPPGPYDFLDPNYRGYVIWPPWGEDNEYFALSAIEAVEQMQRFASRTNSQAIQYQKDHKQCPPDLKTFVSEEEMVYYYANEPDPFGGVWTWDAENCEITNSTYPDLTQLQLPDIH